MRNLIRPALVVLSTLMLASCGTNAPQSISKLPELADKRLLYSFKPVRKSIWSAAGMSETPIISGDTIYYLSGYHWNNQVYVHAVDKKTGKLKWTCKDEIQNFLLDGDRFYATGRGNLFRSEPARISKCFVRAYSTKDGLALWDHPALAGRTGINILGLHENYLCLCSNKMLSALNKDTGEQAWKNETGIQPSVVPNVVMQGGFIFAELFDRNIGKFTTSGIMQSFLKTPPLDIKLPRVLIAKDNMLIIGSGDGKSKVVKIKEDRQQDIETGWVTSNFVIDKGIAYFGSQIAPPQEKVTKVTVKPLPKPEKEGFLLCALDLPTAKYKWQTPVDTQIRSGPLVANNTVYAGAVIQDQDRGCLYAFDAAGGKVLWKSDCLAPLSDVAHGEGMIFVNGGGVCNALDAKTGRSLWTYSLRDAKVVGTPVYENGIVYIVGDDSNLYALRARLAQ